MKTIKIYLLAILLVSLVSIVHAQQSEFQGTWTGERTGSVDRSAYRLEIIEDRWQEFYNNQIEATGTVRFSAGRAELLLADGRVARDLRLLAHGLIEQPVSMWDGYYRFRRVQSSPNSSSTNSQPNTTAQSHIERGNEYFDQGDYNKAIQEYTNAIILNPNLSFAFNNRGFSYHNIGDYDQAIADTTEAIRLNPNNASAYNNRGWAYYFKGDNDQAIIDTTEAIRLNPNFEHAYDSRGWAYLEKGDYTRAATDFETALRINPNLTESRIGLERVRRTQNR